MITSMHRSVDKGSDSGHKVGYSISQEICGGRGCMMVGVLLHARISSIALISWVLIAALQLWQ